MLVKIQFLKRYDINYCYVVCITGVQAVGCGPVPDIAGYVVHMRPNICALDLLTHNNVLKHVMTFFKIKVLVELKEDDPFISVSDSLNALKSLCLIFRV